MTTGASYSQQSTFIWLPVRNVLDIWLVPCENRVRAGDTPSGTTQLLYRAYRTGTKRRRY